MGCGCDSGLISSLVISPGSVSPVYSRPIPRGGEAVVVSLEVLDLNSTVNFEVSLEHKNSTDSSWTSLTSLPPIASAGVESKYVSGVKEMVRLAVQFATGTAVGDMANLGTFNLAWFQYP